ncbi:MAG: hypothetical protein HQK52_06055 [Oligoflexia bacterium]|nr:hypothetical protein [Oligoflexia bacterium]
MKKNLLFFMSLIVVNCCAISCLQTFGSNARNIASVSSNACVNNFIHALKIDLEMQSDLNLIDDLMKNEMYLSDFPRSKEIFGSKITTSMPLQPMLEAIIESIDKKHPAISEFFCAVVENKLLPEMDENAQLMVKRVIHHTFLLDAITKAAGDNIQIMEELQTHFYKKRQAFGIRSDFFNSAIDMYRVTGTWFAPAKTLTMDWVYNNTLATRKLGQLTSANFKKMQVQLALNIVEAILKDYTTGYYSNALTGVAPAITIADAGRLVGQEYFLETSTHQDWISLYATWNLAFMTGYSPTMNLFYSKWLIPIVLDVAPNKFLQYRMVSLWLAENFRLFSMITNPKGHPIPRNREISTLWGEVNLKYAKEYTLKYKNRELTGVKDLIMIPMVELRDKIINLIPAYL